MIFSLDICVALMPLVFAAMVSGAAAVAAGIITYEVATIGTMVALVLLPPQRRAPARLLGSIASVKPPLER